MPLAVLWIIAGVAFADRAFADEAYFRELAASVRDTSFPSLHKAKIKMRPFRSDSVYFYARFTARSFLFGSKLDYVIGYNEEALRRQAPAEALSAVMAHELAHLDYYARRNRWRLLGLIRLASPASAARFERGADREAIRRGYGPGLKAYREWLYRNIPGREVARKKRIYLTPAEIDALVQNCTSHMSSECALSGLAVK